jgi:2',3'-cyclic-nucleotide 2'-phosphodiesterase (5'-nucleotidase family)
MPCPVKKIFFSHNFPVDYVCLGNHEFDHGEEELKKRIKESKFKWINSNVYQHNKLLEGTLEFEILIFDNIVTNQNLF